MEKKKSRRYGIGKVECARKEMHMQKEMYAKKEIHAQKDTHAKKETYAKKETQAKTGMREKEGRTQKGKRIAAGLIAAMMFLLAVAVDIPALYASEEIFTLSLPVYSGCRYELGNMHCEKIEEQRDRTVIYCKTGEQVELRVDTQVPIESICLEENGKVLVAFNGPGLNFDMPGKDVSLRINWEEEKSEETPSEDTSGKRTELTADETDEDTEEERITEEKITENGAEIVEPEKTTEGLTEHVPEEATEEATERVPEEATEEATERVPEEATEELTERVPEEATEEATEALTGDTSGERAAEEMAESAPGNKMTEEISEKEGAESETEGGTEAEERKAEAEGGTETEAETESGTEPETEVETETEIETEIETDVELLMQQTKGAAESTPDSFKLTTGDFYYAPSALQNGDASTTYKTVTFYEEDGSETTRTAFCLQPYASGPDNGHVYEKDDVKELEDGNAKDKNVAKALYYLFGGPAWGKTIEYADGSGSVNLKQTMEAAGCSSTAHFYCISHYVVSYFYLGPDGKWNYARPDETVANVFNDSGVKVIKDLAAKIKKLPVPNTTLSTASVTAVLSAGKIRTQSLVYQTMDENIGTIVLGDGITLVNETAGTAQTGTVKLRGGDRFHLEANPLKLSGTVNYTIKTTYAVDFTAYKLELAGRQDIGFSYYSGEKSLHFSVDWPGSGILKIRKTDGETGTNAAYNGHYTLAGAVYGIYEDAECTQKLTELVTGADGTAQAAFTLGTYYLKELQAPAGYKTDPQIHSVSLSNTAETVEYKLTDQPLKKKIGVIKKDVQTGKTTPQNVQASFAGAEYTIYRDAACTGAVETIVADHTGRAVSSELRLDDYYVKETKAPEGYLLDTSVYPVKMEQKDGIELYQVSSAEQIVRGSLALMKYLDDNLDESVLQDLYDSGKLSGIRFQLIHSDKTVTPVTIETDRYGYAATKKQELSYGTWYLSEDPQTTPEGYQGIKNVKVEIREEGTEQIYVVTNKPYQAYLCIQKKDKDSGNLITTDQAEFQILDLDGTPVQMPTFDGYTDTFRTNEQGEIHLTKSLKGGSYTLVETKAPAGYKRAEPLAFKVSENAVFQEPLILICQDEPRKGLVRITKIDRNTGAHCGPGFVFEIRVKEDILDGNGRIRTEEWDGVQQELTAGTVADTVITDTEGVAVSRELYPGIYQVQEIKPGEYYGDNQETYTVEITAEEKEGGDIETGDMENGDMENGDMGEEVSGSGGLIIAELEIENEKTALEIRKKDAKTEAPMSGVTFWLWEKDGDGKREDTENTENTEGMENTENGENAENTEKVENTENGEKVEDAENTEGVENAENKREAATDENGILRFEDLRHSATYCLQEKETKPGYVLDSNIYEFTVDEKGRIEGEVVSCVVLMNEPEEPLPPETEDETETEPEAETEPETLEPEPITEPEPPIETEIQTEQTTEIETEAETLEETQKADETEGETGDRETERKKDSVVMVDSGGSPKTGDMTPIAGLLFLALCSLTLGIMELLRRIKYGEKY